MTTTDPPPMPSQPSSPVVLVVDDDRDIGDLVVAVLTDAGYQVSLLAQVAPELVATAVGRLEPDCILLDSTTSADYGESWATAATLAVRGRPVPVVMFTAHAVAAQEARADTSARSQAAHFAGVLLKPFELEELPGVVAHAVGRSDPFDRSPLADATRTQTLVEQLAAGGAQDIRRSTRREWVTCRAPSGHLVQLYWWQAAGQYICGAYEEANATMQPIGRFTDRDAAIACALAG
jgi:CheY-like chemotaxis protein